MRAQSTTATIAVSVLIVVLTATACASTDTTTMLGPDDSLPPEETYLFEVGTHCGVGFLGLPVNGHFWITDEAAGERNWIPAEWDATVDSGEQSITMELRLSADGTILFATVADRSVSYRQVTPDDVLDECA